MNLPPNATHYVQFRASTITNGRSPAVYRIKRVSWEALGNLSYYRTLREGPRICFFWQLTHSYIQVEGRLA